MESPLSLHACIRTMNPPLTPPRRGTGADERSLPSWEGSGVGRFMESPLSLRACIGTMNRSDSDRGRYHPQRSRKDESVGDFPGVLARATRCDRGPVAVRYFAPANSGHGSWVEQDSGRRMGAVRKLVLCHGNAYTSDLRTDERAGFLAR